MSESKKYVAKNTVLQEVSKNRHRNEPCWCGSGKKIKNCKCLQLKQEERKYQLLNELQDRKQKLGLK